MRASATAPVTNRRIFMTFALVVVIEREEGIGSVLGTLLDTHAAGHFGAPFGARLEARQ